jgi:hypothetical protein
MAYQWLRRHSLDAASRSPERNPMTTQAELTAQQKEEYVRSKWILVDVNTRAGTSRGPVWARIPFGWTVVLCAEAWSHIHDTPRRSTKEEAISDAYSFTIDREEEIRKLETGIRMVEHQMLRASGDSIKVVMGECCTLSKGLEGAYATCAVGWCDVLTRLQQALAELRRGMR